MDNLKCIEDMDDWTDLDPYHPSETGNAYLAEQLIDMICAQIRNFPAYNETVVRYIKAYERMHRESLLGIITRENMRKTLDAIEEDYRTKTQKWIFQEATYDDFYRILNKGNW